MPITSAIEEPFTFTTDYMKNYTFTMGNIAGNSTKMEEILGEDTRNKAEKNDSQPNNVEMSWTPATFTAENLEPNYKTEIFKRDGTGLTGMLVWAKTSIDVYLSNGYQYFIFPRGTPVVLKLQKYDEKPVVGMVIFQVDNIRIPEIFFPITSQQMQSHNFTLGNIRGNMTDIEKILGVDTLDKALKSDGQPNSVGMSWTPATFTVSNLHDYYQFHVRDDFYGETGLNYTGKTNIEIKVSSLDGKKNFVFPEGTDVCLSLTKKKDELSQNAVGTVTFDICDIIEIIL
jgi:hypothetical protein